MELFCSEDQATRRFVIHQFHPPPISNSFNSHRGLFHDSKKKRERPRIKTDSKNVPPSPSFPPPPIRICKLGRKADETRNPLTYAWLYTQGTRRNSGDSTVLRGGEAVVFLVEIRVEQWRGLVTVSFPTERIPSTKGEGVLDKQSFSLPLHSHC